MQKFFKQKNKGFTLIETLVAISIFTMSLLGLMSILASGISNTNYAKQKMTATYLAQEGIEYARNIRDTKVLSSASGTDGWIAFNVLSNASITPSSVVAGFDRSVQKSVVGPDEVKIISTVTCTQCSSRYIVTLSEDLFNWVE